MKRGYPTRVLVNGLTVALLGAAAGVNVFTAMISRHPLGHSLAAAVCAVVSVLMVVRMTREALNVTDEPTEPGR